MQYDKGVKILSMGALNSLDCLNFGVLVRGIFPMLLFQSTVVEAQGGVLEHTELIPLLSTSRVLLVTRVETSTPVLMII